MGEISGAPAEARPEARQAERQRILQQRICDLNLRIEGTRLEPLVQRLYAELRAAGLRRFTPVVYLSDEWGCPDRLPVIGVPFFLANDQLLRLEEERVGLVEAQSDAEILRYLRHEAGHAFNYAYVLYATPEWERLFGTFARPYIEVYTPQAFSQDYVRYLPGWYAQKHPDEDFAETFAVWLDPASQWRETFRDWGCYSKLEYVDTKARELADVAPAVPATEYVTTEECLTCSLEEHYRRQHRDSIPAPPGLDVILHGIFVTPAAAGPGVLLSGAADFLDEHRRRIAAAIFYWTGISYPDLHALLDHVRARCSALNLQVTADRETALIALTTVLTTLCMNRLYRGDFVPRTCVGQRTP